MITKPTVLLLGAGASAPFGFPTGAGLRDLLCRYTHGNLSGPLNTPVNAGWWSRARLEDFLEQLRDSARISVDAFLEHRPDLVEIGKAAIAAALIPYEHHNHLFFDLTRAGRWYGHLFEQMACEEKRWCRNALTVITYNYDRSLEYFLAKALSRSFDRSETTARNIVESIPILHLHGQLGAIGVELGCRPYDVDCSPERIEIAAAGIRIVSEASPDTEEFHLARAALKNAERIYILGFGYNQVNLERLQRGSFPQGKFFVGTCYGMLEGEQQEAKGWFQGGFALSPSDFTITETLRYYPPLRQA